MPANLVTLGDHIRKRRIDAGLLQKDVAQIIDVSEDTVTFWENGKTQPRLNSYPAIFKFLGYYPFEHEFESISGKIRRYRYLNGCTYNQLGKEIGVNGFTVREWEQCISKISKANRVRLDAILNKLFLQYSSN